MNIKTRPESFPSETTASVKSANWQTGLMPPVSMQTHSWRPDASGLKVQARASLHASVTRKQKRNFKCLLTDVSVQPLRGLGRAIFHQPPQLQYISGFLSVRNGAQLLHLGKGLAGMHRRLRPGSTVKTSVLAKSVATITGDNRWTLPQLWCLGGASAPSFMNARPLCTAAGTSHEAGLLHAHVLYLTLCICMHTCNY